jgi:hypothetical protein
MKSLKKGTPKKAKATPVKKAIVKKSPAKKSAPKKKATAKPLYRARPRQGEWFLQEWKLGSYQEEEYCSVLGALQVPIKYGNREEAEAACALRAATAAATAAAVPRQVPIGVPV